jgi:hypothetical protein
MFSGRRSVPEELDTSRLLQKPWVAEKFRERGGLRLEETIVELRAETNWGWIRTSSRSMSKGPSTTSCSVWKRPLPGHALRFLSKTATGML